MANDLSRVGDRLARARERSGSGLASAWLPTGRSDARREPIRRAFPTERDREREREARADAGRERRPPPTLVAIHVEVRHPEGSAAEAQRAEQIIDAQVAQVAQEQDFEFAIEDERAAHADAVSATDESSDPMPALPMLSARVAGAYDQRARVSSTLQHYVAARALSAYATQHSFVAGGGGREPRMLDLRA